MIMLWPQETVPFRVPKFYFGATWYCFQWPIFIFFDLNFFFCDIPTGFLTVFGFRVFPTFHHFSIRELVHHMAVSWSGYLCSHHQLRLDHREHPLGRAREESLQPGRDRTRLRQVQGRNQRGFLMLELVGSQFFGNKHGMGLQKVDC